MMADLIIVTQFMTEQSMLLTHRQHLTGLDVDVLRHCSSYSSISRSRYITRPRNFKKSGPVPSALHRSNVASLTPQRFASCR